MGSVPPYFTQTRAKSLDALESATVWGLVKKSRRSVPQNTTGAKFVAQADGDAVLVPTSELPYDALVVRRVGQADTQDGKAFRRANANILDLQIGGHGSFLRSKVERRKDISRVGVAFGTSRNGGFSVVVPLWQDAVTICNISICARHGSWTGDEAPEKSCLGTRQFFTFIKIRVRLLLTL